MVTRYVFLIRRNLIRIQESDELKVKKTTQKGFKYFCNILIIELMPILEANSTILNCKFELSFMFERRFKFF